MKKGLSLSDALFPVGLEPVYLGKQKGKNLWLLEENNASKNTGNKSYKKIPQFRAVVAKDNDHVFSVVTDSYYLVTNREAVDLGKECFRQIFVLNKEEDMEFYNLNMPGTRSSCHIDFIHKGEAIKPFSEQDAWFPFLRITNSYNRSYALNFKLGYCRWICKNGMIFGGQSIDFKFHHNRKIDHAVAYFSLRSGEFAEFEKSFIESLHNLERYHVPPKHIWPLTCKVFGIKMPTKGKTRQEESYTIKKHQIEKLSEKYFKELGQNGYAALNILTDFATRPVGYISVEQSVDSLQNKAGAWISEFISEIENRKFSYDDYLAEYLQHAA